MPTDSFANHIGALNDPARDAFAIQPSDSGALAVLPRALYVGTGGALTLRCVDGQADVVFKNVGSGQILDLRVSHVRATGTTAADLVGLA